MSDTQFSEIWKAAIAEYQSITNRKVSVDGNITSPESLRAAFKQGLQKVKTIYKGRKKVEDRVQSVLPALCLVLNALGSVTSVHFPPATVMSSAVCMLLDAKAQYAMYNAIETLFQQLDLYLERLHIHLRREMGTEMRQVAQKVLCQMLVILGLATKKIEDGHFSKYSPSDNWLSY
ncbi:hypothetical protein AX17_007294 [Amanita inopinata Kibby_2008]|nr:hypothetical protein AX17_007294 [Amanita inopinata Kibby_2008]